jgi:SPP1 gp7 family putative phage head morphogenesis protein
MSHIKLNLFVKAHSHSTKLRKRKQRRLKPVRPSRKNELWYKAELLRVVNLLRSTTERELTPLVKQVTQGFGDALPPSIDHQVQLIARKFGNIGSVAKRLAATAAQRNLQSTDEQLAESIRRAVGVNISSILSADGVREAISEAVAANVDLIASIPEQYFAKLRETLSKNWEAGSRWEDLVDTIKHVGDVTASRAKLIARDQTSKMNGAFNQARQTSVGIERYQWQTAGDERVRPTHADNDGKVFSWDDPPADTGNPGDDINCRCVAIPIFDLDEDEGQAS